VEPAQAYAMALALKDKGPVLLGMVPNDGHGASTTVDVITFIAETFGRTLRRLE
jgi:hypothetical protein